MSRQPREGPWNSEPLLQDGGGVRIFAVCPSECAVCTYVGVFKSTDILVRIRDIGVLVFESVE